jgi:hypothetical protein
MRVLFVQQPASQGGFNPYLKGVDRAEFQTPFDRTDRSARRTDSARFAHMAESARQCA